MGSIPVIQRVRLGSGNAAEASCTGSGYVEVTARVPARMGLFFSLYFYFTFGAAEGSRGSRRRFARSFFAFSHYSLHTRDVMYE